MHLVYYYLFTKNTLFVRILIKKKQLSVANVNNVQNYKNMIRCSN